MILCFSYLNHLWMHSKNSELEQNPGFETRFGRGVVMELQNENSLLESSHVESSLVESNFVESSLGENSLVELEQETEETRIPS